MCFFVITILLNNLTQEVVTVHKDLYETNTSYHLILFQQDISFFIIFYNLRALLKDNSQIKTYNKLGRRQFSLMLTRVEKKEISLKNNFNPVIIFRPIISFYLILSLIPLVDRFSLCNGLRLSTRTDIHTHIVLQGL